MRLVLPHIGDAVEAQPVPNLSHLSELVIRCLPLAQAKEGSV